jgi:glycine/D-amino acid oxidase-like deaminating enzyme
VREYSYWLDTVPVAHESRESQIPNPESLPPRADVVVVGAGYTGLSAARRLAMSGASVLVLEREQIGWGASSRNGGQVLTGLKLDASTLVRRYGETKARRLFDVGRDAIAALESVIDQESLDCEYERTGHLQAAWKPSHFEAFREEQSLLARVFDHRVELVSRSDQRSEIGSDRYYGLSIDDASRAINPARYVHALAMAARRRGACILTGIAVTALARESTGWRVATTSGAVSARDVLIATNGYTGGVTPALLRRLIPIGSYIVATEPLSPADAHALLPKRRMAFDSKNFLFYFRLTRDNRLLFGGRAEFRAPSSDATRRAAAILRRGLAEIFPALAGKAIEYAWGGNVAFTRDEMPRAGKLEGMYFAAGYCGHGIAMATHLGDLVARRIAGESIAHPMMDQSWPAIPLYSGRPWFLPIAGAYYKVRDWIS